MKDVNSDTLTTVDCFTRLLHWPPWIANDMNKGEIANDSLKEHLQTTKMRAFLFVGLLQCLLGDDVFHQRTHEKLSI